jgi:hypothetical protein
MVDSENRNSTFSMTPIMCVWLWVQVNSKGKGQARQRRLSLYVKLTKQLTGPRRGR